jgi:hypothetical protein
MQRECLRAACGAPPRTRARAASASASAVPCRAATPRRAAPPHHPPHAPPPPAPQALRSSARAAAASSSSASAAAAAADVTLSLPSFGADAAQHDALMADMAAFLVDDLGHLFDDTGIDASRYEEKMARARKTQKCAQIRPPPISRANGRCFFCRSFLTR